MLPFFRKIRKQLAKDNKFFQYSRYAIGEIILVVIGILVALQVNNWNERRKEAISAEVTSKKYIASIYKDLKTEIKSIEANINIFSQQYKHGIEGMRFFETKRAMDIDSSRIALIVGWRLTDVISSENGANTWEGIKDQGGQSLIGNDSLVSRLNTFYASYEALAERFNQLPKKSRMELRERVSICRNSKELEEMFKYGFKNVESLSKESQNCIFLIEDLQNRISTITISSIVMGEYSLETKKIGIELAQYLEDNYPYLK